jgi:hypothetical protein
MDMSGFCLGVAFTLVAAAVPAEHFTLAWTHSVEKIRWEEDYAVREGWLVLEAARVKGSGAGMEPGEGAVWRDGWWHYRPQGAPLEKLTLANSRYGGDYELCWDGRCVALARLLPHSATAVELFPCRKKKS